MATRKSFVPAALSRLFAGTNLTPAASENSHRDDDGGDDDAPERPAALSQSDVERIARNAEAAVTEAVDSANTRWASVLNHEVGDGDAKHAVISNPGRASAAVALLADTDMPADKIIAVISKPAFATLSGEPILVSQDDPNVIAAAAARERLRAAPNPGTAANGGGSGSGGDGTGADADTRGVTRESRAKKTAARNAQETQRAGGEKNVARPVTSNV